MRAPPSSLIRKYFPLGKSPSPFELSCIAERQLEHDVHNVFAVDKLGCRHGFPRAMVMYPVRQIPIKSVNSGMIRLTCPHLVKEIDKLESCGGIKDINSSLASSSEMKSDFNRTNMTWSSIRKDSCEIKDVECVKEALGVEGCNHFFESGIIGVSKGRTDDAKCLHAHTADYILRFQNQIGKAVLSKLEQEGVDTSGCSGSRH